MNQRIFKLLVPLGALLICVILIEVGLSFFFGKNDTYYIWRPHLEYTFGLDDVTLRGVSKFARSTYSSIGARSDEISAQPSYKIAAFGGSTTECAALDQDATWTQLLQSGLNQESKHGPFWVGNFGKSGNDSHHHIIQTKKILENEQLRDTQLVLYLVGFNDVNRAMQNEDKYLNFDPEKLRRAAFMVVPDEDLPLHRRTALWKFLKHVRFNLRLNKYEKEELAELYKEVRKKRLEVKKTRLMPNLETALERYKNNIDSLITLCRAMNKTPVIITQPVLWRPDITEASEQVLYTFFDERENLETETLFQCMKLFNEASIEVAEHNNALYIDLFNHSREDWFYDDCHFNKNGAQQVADIIVSEIKPLLKQ